MFVADAAHPPIRQTCLCQHNVHVTYLPRLAYLPAVHLHHLCHMAPPTVPMRCPKSFSRSGMLRPTGGLAHGSYLAEQAELSTGIH